MARSPDYQRDGVTLFNGDCVEILPEISTVDADILTDPPYGISASGGIGKYGREKWQNDKDSRWDSTTPAPEVFDILRKFSRRQIIWGMNYFPLPPTRNYLVWDKGAGFKDRDFAECELAWCSWDANARVFSRDPLARGDYKGKIHPTQKPLALIEWCLKLLCPKGVIIDPFAGSGTTVLACINANVPCIAIEKDPIHFANMLKRVEQAQRMDRTSLWSAKELIQEIQRPLFDG